MGRANRTARVKSRTRAMLKGWNQEKKRWKAPLFVGGESLTAAEIIARLQQNQGRHNQVDMCRVYLAFAIAARDEAIAKEQTFQENLAAVLRQQLGKDLVRLKRYGLSPIKRRGPLSAKRTVIAKFKEKATRQLRNPLTKRQRAAITTEPQPTLVVHGLPGAQAADMTIAPASSRTAQ